MNKQQKRQQAIRSIISERNVYTQQELTRLLNEAGFDCTQATVSRDIANMHLGKTPAKFYVLPEEVRLHRVASQLIVGVHAAGNITVVKTHAGSAGSVAEALDQAAFSGVIGSVAGDNTILLVVETPEQAVELKNALDAYCS